MSMNLDLAIQNQVMGRSIMDDALHGVASDLGDGHYRVNAFYTSADEATSILGNPLAAYIPNPITMYVRPPTLPPANTNPDSFSEPIGGGYTVSFDSAAQTWALNKMTARTGLSGFWSSLMNKPRETPVPLMSKSGANSMHRFLTTIEEMDLPMELKSKIAEIVVGKTDNTGITEFVGGQVVITALDNPFQSDSYLYSQGQALDILASEYVAPPLLTTTHTHESEYVAPPVGSGTPKFPIHTHNYRPF
jgi:hypothetical protein